MNDEQGRALKSRYQQARNARSGWETQWQETCRRILPAYADGFFQGARPTEGEPRTDEMADATAAAALPKFAAALESMLTPRGALWHFLRPMDRMLLRRHRSVREYYDEVSAALFRYRYAPRANFASQQHEGYMGLGSVGTSVMYVDKLDWPGGGVRYRALHLGEVVILENHQGIIDTVFRELDLTARQALQRFSRPGDTLPEQLRKEAGDPAKRDTKHKFLQCVYPRSEAEGYAPERLDAKGMRYASVTIYEKGGEVVREDGYNTFPFPVGRYVQAPGEIYGRSPAMLALPAIKTLNEQKWTMLTQGHRALDPVLLAYDDGVLDAFSLKPGAINPGGVTPDGRPLVHALPTGNIQVGVELMNEERMLINDVFLVNLFQILIETPQMTATEVLQRVQEKGSMLSPTMGRQQSEQLGPLIEREIDVLAAQGLLPPMPDIVREAGAFYEVVYDSPLSRSQRAEQASGFMRLVDYAREFVTATGQQEPADWFHWDVAVPELADIFAVPARWMKSPEMVLAMRQARQQRIEQQQAVDALPAAAGAMKALPAMQALGNQGAA